MALPDPEPGTRVLVTGASSGIGTELARELAGRGYDLVLAARSLDRLEELAGELPVTAETRAVDLSSAEARQALVDELHDVVGVCNNAGFGTSGRFLDQDPEREQEMIRLNVEALHHLTAAFLPQMIERGAGAILNLASTAAFQPLPGMATYAATKAFVASFSEAVHAELAGTGVSVTALCPGPTKTAFAEVAGVGEVWRRTPDLVLMGPEDVARAGVEAMVAGRRTAVPGLTNKLSSFGGRFVPRTFLLPVAAYAAKRA